MAEGLARKKRVRAGHRASATRTIRAARKLLEEEMPRLLRLKMSLEEKLDVLKRIDGEVLDLLDEDSLGEEIELADGFKEDIYATLVKIETRRAPSSRASTPRHSTALEDSSATAAAMTYKARLPKLTIRPFNGDLAAWTTFWDSYKAAVHANPQI